MEKSITLLNFLNKFFQQNKILKPNIVILTAISGGQDSSFLFFLLLQFKNQWNWKLALIWCNHLWQTENFYSMLHIFKLSIFFQLPFFFVITEKYILSEQKARHWRLNVFQRIALYSHTEYILNGHTASDRIETTLFHLLRGSGVEGFANFKYKKIISNNKWKNFFVKTLSKNKTLKYKLLKKKIFLQKSKKPYFFKIKKKFQRSKKSNIIENYSNIYILYNKFDFEKKAL